VSSSETNICTQKTEHRVPTLTISDKVDFSKVRTFLESIARNSESSKYTYEMGLKHLQRFLTGGSYSDNNNNNNYHHHNDYNVETILLPLQNGMVNVYELIDTFVSYLVTTSSSSSPYSV
jgi:hypothetical protein